MVSIQLGTYWTGCMSELLKGRKKKKRSTTIWFSYDLPSAQFVLLSSRTISRPAHRQQSLPSQDSFRFTGEWWWITDHKKKKNLHLTTKNTWAPDSDSFIATHGSDHNLQVYRTLVGAGEETYFEPGRQHGGKENRLSLKGHFTVVLLWRTNTVCAAARWHDPGGLNNKKHAAFQVNNLSLFTKRGLLLCWLCDAH